MKKISVLIVGHDGDTYQTTETLENQNGTLGNIELTDSLEGALGRLLDDRFDAILLDPDVNKAPGLESVRRLNAAAPNAAIVVVAKQPGDARLATECVRFGAQDYIDKENLSPLLLEKSINYAVESKSRVLEKEALFSDLSDALTMIEKLQHLLPLCANCRKFYHKEDGDWLDIDSFLERNGMHRSPTICPRCLDSLQNR